MLKDIQALDEDKRKKLSPIKPFSNITLHVFTEYHLTHLYVVFDKDLGVTVIIY